MNYALFATLLAMILVAVGVIGSFLGALAATDGRSPLKGALALAVIAAAATLGAAWTAGAWSR